jgi:Nuclease-related domain
MDREAGPETDGTTPLPAVPAREEDREARIPSPHPIFGGLASDPRMPIWIGRAVVAAAVGIGVTIWLNWRYGLTAAAVVAIADTIYRSRTTAVIPAAARVTSAQRRTRRRLLLLRPFGYVALHARAIPGSGSVIDHLVIGPGGVYAVDSERWDRRLPVRTGAGGLLYHGPFARKERLAHARWEAAQAAMLVGAGLQSQIRVHPAIAIYGPTIPWTIARLDGVDVFSGHRLRSYLMRQTRKNRANALSAQQIMEIHDAADAALPPVG